MFHFFPFFLTGSLRGFPLIKTYILRLQRPTKTNGTKPHSLKAERGSWGAVPPDKLLSAEFIVHSLLS